MSQTNYKILVADDIEQNLDLIDAYLDPLGHELIFANDGKEALDLAMKHKPDMLLLDVMMPGMTGVQVCAELRKNREFHFTPIILITSLSEVEDKVNAIEAGATDFLTKPVNKIELRTRVNSLLTQKSLYDDLIHSYDLIVALVQAVEARDKYTSGHSERVGNIARRFALFLKLNPTLVDQIHRAGMLHDIGKIGISDTILNKPDVLTADEYNIILDHPIIGANIIGSVKSLEPIVPLIKHHHERYDGTGHPDGLSGEEIPIGARIISITDTFDAIISRRTYSNERTRDDAIRIFSEERGSGQWDPDLVDRFLDFLSKESNLPSDAPSDDQAVASFLQE